MSRGGGDGSRLQVGAPLHVQGSTAPTAALAARVRFAAGGRRAARRVYARGGAKKASRFTRTLRNAPSEDERPIHQCEAPPKRSDKRQPKRVQRRRVGGAKAATEARTALRMAACAANQSETRRAMCWQVEAVGQVDCARRQGGARRAPGPGKDTVREVNVARDA